MLSNRIELIYVAAIVAGQDHPHAIVGIVAIALVQCREFWRWANSIAEFSCKGWRIRRNQR